MRIHIVILGSKGLERVSEWNLCVLSSVLKGRDHGYAHARRLSLQNKFVGSTQNSTLDLRSIKHFRIAGPVLIDI